MKIDMNKMYIHMARKGLNFSELSNVSSVSRATLSYIKNGKSCRPDIVAKIASALEVDVAELVLDEGD